MLRLIQVGNSLPYSMIVDPSAQFQPGTIGQIKVFGNQITLGVSDGLAPFGIIDDYRTTAFTRAKIDEEIIARVTPTISGGIPVASQDTTILLAESNVVASSFVSSDVACTLTPKNGAITFLAGTPLNYDYAGSGTYDSIRTFVSYVYQVPGIPGDDTTLGSGRVTVWFDRMIFETDQFETNVRYAPNQALFVNESGLLTTRQLSESYPGVAMVIAPPSQISESLMALWL